MKNHLWIIAALLVSASCKKAENRKCFKSAGNPGTKTIVLPAFDRLFLHEHIEYLLIQDSTDRVVIAGGNHLLNFIDCTVTDGQLEIKNQNKCAFLRSYKQKIKVEIHFTTLINLRFEGTEPLNNLDTLNTPYFTMLIRDGAGSVNLKLKSEWIYADIAHGWGDYTLAGSTKFAWLAARSNGYCNTYDLAISDSVEVYSDTPGTMKINANGIPVRGKVKCTGDIWYEGAPTMISVQKTSTGKLIQK
jgi:hypothetical protein